jgi:spermidine synthase
MDSSETTTERALATLALESIVGRRGGFAPAAPLTVLIGGLGLGYTLAEFAADSRVGQVIVAEIESELVEWHRAGLLPLTERLRADPRIRILAQSVQAVVAVQPAGSLDVLVLDVDNGPGYLVYDVNSAIYERAFLTACRKALADKGVLVVWSAAEAPELASALEMAFGSVSHHPMPVRRGERADHYLAYVAPAHADQDAACQEL